MKEAGGLPGDGGYELGWGLVELGSAYLSSFEQIRRFHRAAAESPLLTRELVQVAILDGADVPYVARHEGRASLQLSARVGDGFPAADTAVGNALLAQMDDGEVRRFAVGVSLVAQRPSTEELARYGKAVQARASQIASPTRWA